MPYKPLLSGGATIEISVEEYNGLVRDSEQLAIIKRYIEEGEYASVSDIKLILGIKESVRKENEE